jgi:hypothetical protein
VNSAIAIERIAAVLGVVLLATGLNVMAFRRHLVSVFLGAQCAVFGAVLLAASKPDPLRMELAAALSLGAAALVPIALAALAQWRRLRGSVEVATLQEMDGEPTNA